MAVNPSEMRSELSVCPLCRGYGFSDAALLQHMHNRGLGGHAHMYYPSVRLYEKGSARKHINQPQHGICGFCVGTGVDAPPEKIVEWARVKIAHYTRPCPPIEALAENVFLVCDFGVPCTLIAREVRELHEFYQSAVELARTMLAKDQSR